MRRSVIALLVGMLSILIFLFAGATVFASEEGEISAHNSSRYLGDGLWEWTVYIKGSPETLREIEFVDYTLHPSFKKRHHRIPKTLDPRYPFGLRARGWGVFNIKIEVHFRNGDVHPLTHDLVFRAPRAKTEVSLETRNDAQQIGKTLWRWTVYLKAPPEVIDQIRCVEYTLHPTFPDPVHEVCRTGTPERPFALTARGWGTFNVKLRVFFKDGSVKRLIHRLKF